MPKFPIDQIIIVDVTVPETSASSNDRSRIKFAPSKKYLTRRKKPDGLIEFYDLGCIKTEDSYETIPSFLIAPPFQYSLSLAYVRALVADDYNDLRDYILGFSTSSLKTTFRKITKNNSFEYHLRLLAGERESELNDYPEWTADGFRATEDELDSGIEIYNGFSSDYIPDGFPLPEVHTTQLGYFVADKYTNQSPYTYQRPLVLKTAAHQKITALPSFDASEVSFTPSKNMKVYLMPDLAYFNGQSQVLTSLGSKTAYLNLFYRVRPREWMLPSSPNYRKYGAELLYPYAYSNDQYQAVVQTVAAHQSLVDTRGVTQLEDGVTWVAGFDFESTAGSGYPQQEYLQAVAWSRVPDSEVDKGILNAIVEKDGVYYYFWNITLDT